MATPGPTLPTPRPSALWQRWLPIQYRIIRLLGPLAHAWWTSFGLGNVVELRVAGRRTGTQRRILLGLLRSGDHWFLGHPNGDVAWTRNLEAAENAELVFRPPSGIAVRATRLPPGELREPRSPRPASTSSRATSCTGSPAGTSAPSERTS